MMKMLLAAAALAVGVSGMSTGAEAKMMMMKHGAKPAMCYHTMMGKKHWHACGMMPMHRHMMMPMHPHMMKPMHPHMMKPMHPHMMKPMMKPMHPHMMKPMKKM